jgi:hypothetical protein
VLNPGERSGGGDLLRYFLQGCNCISHVGFSKSADQWLIKKHGSAEEKSKTKETLRKETSTMKF